MDRQQCFVKILEKTGIAFNWIPIDTIYRFLLQILRIERALSQRVLIGWGKVVFVVNFIDEKQTR